MEQEGDDRPNPNMIMEMDASLLGWGAVPDGVCINGLWSEKSVLSTSIIWNRWQQNVCLATEGHTPPFKDGQQNSSLLHKQDGRHEIYCSFPLGLFSVVVVPSEMNYTLSRVSSGKEQCDSGPRVPLATVINRVDTQQRSIQQVNEDDGSVLAGFICILVESPTGVPCQLEIGPVRSNNRCIPDLMEGSGLMCVSPICSNWGMLLEGSAGTSITSVDSTNMVHSTMVPHPIGPTSTCSLRSVQSFIVIIAGCYSLPIVSTSCL